MRHRPGRIGSVETMPLTETGKIDEQALVENIKRKIVSDGPSPVSTTV